MNRKSTYELLLPILCLMCAIMGIIIITVPIQKNTARIFNYIEDIIILILIFDYVFQVIKSKNRLKYISNNKIDFLSFIHSNILYQIVLLIGIGSIIDKKILLDLCVFIRVTILIARFNREMGSMLKNNKIVFLLISTTLVIILGAIAMSLAEGMTLGDALWWSFVTFTTVGYGDILLKTILGKIIAVILMIFGIGFITVLTSTLAIYIINGKGTKGKGYKGEVVELIKNKLDNYEELSEEDMDYICKTIKSLK